MAGWCPTLCGRPCLGEPLTVYDDGTRTRSFCYVSDLIDGLYRLLMSDETDPVNLGNPHEITMLELAHTGDRPDRRSQSRCRVCHAWRCAHRGRSADPPAGHQQRQSAPGLGAARLAGGRTEKHDRVLCAGASRCPRGLHAVALPSHFARPDTPRQPSTAHSRWRSVPWRRWVWSWRGRRSPGRSRSSSARRGGLLLLRRPALGLYALAFAIPFGSLRSDECRAATA